jgi:hypothetical protein
MLKTNYYNNSSYFEDNWRFGKGDGIKLADLCQNMENIEDNRCFCYDIATSMTMLGLDCDVVPLYKYYTLQIIHAARLGEFATTTEEYSILSNLCCKCGALTAILKLNTDINQAVTLAKAFIPISSILNDQAGTSVFGCKAVFLQPLYDYRNTDLTAVVRTLNLLNTEIRENFIDQNGRLFGNMPVGPIEGLDPESIMILAIDKFIEFVSSEGFMVLEYKHIPLFYEYNKGYNVELADRYRQMYGGKTL